jgi:hypothetical protein
MIITDNASLIVKTIKEVSENRPEIKNIIIDDFQYIMANEFMRRSKETGYNKFNDIGQSAWAIINALNSARQDITSVVLSHSEQSETGKTKIKTVGKMLDDKIVIEGMFTVVLQSIVHDNRYLFITQNNGQNTCKSPKGLFDSDSIANDLNDIISAYVQYQSVDLEELKADFLEEFENATNENEVRKALMRYPEFKKDDLVIAMCKSKIEDLKNDSSVSE